MTNNVPYLPQTGDTVQTLYILVTPEMAEEWLKFNTGNLRVRQTFVTKLAGAIRRGEWTLNGDQIRFAKNGRLIDGQHRLHAIIAAGVGVVTGVTVNLEESVFSTIDTDRKTRKTSDVLYLNGHKNTNALTAAAKMIFLYYKTGNPFSGGAQHQPTAAQLEELLQDHPGIEWAVNKVQNSTGLRGLLEPSSLAMCLFFMSAKDPVSATEFFEALETRIMKEGDKYVGVRNLTERLIRDRIAITSLGKKAKLVMTIKAFRYFRLGKPLKQLKVKANNGEYGADAFEF